MKMLKRADPWCYATREGARMELRPPNKFICLTCRVQSVTEAQLVHKANCPIGVKHGHL